MWARFSHSSRPAPGQNQPPVPLVPGKATGKWIWHPPHLAPNFDYYDTMITVMYLSTAIGLTPGGSSTVHTHKQYVEQHKYKQYIEQHK